MFKTFYPDQYLASTYVIDFEKLYEKGFRGLIFDIDNTLVPHNAPADDRAVALFERLKRIGYRCCLISNNQEPRVKMFKTNTVFVGDQLFTDVWGAKRAGIPNILVKPLHPKEEIQIVLKRYLEKIVLFFYRRETRKRKNG